MVNLEHGGNCLRVLGALVWIVGLPGTCRIETLGFVLTSPSPSCPSTLSLRSSTQYESKHRFEVVAIIPVTNRKDSFLSEYAEAHRSLRFAREFGDVIAKYEARLELLRDLGAQDDIELSELSKRDFFLFIDSALYMCVASLVLMDNGNIRALWKFGDDDLVGIHFRGNGMASYVIFKHISQGDVSRDFGMTSLDGIRTEIRRFGFEEELKRWPEGT